MGRILDKRYYNSVCIFYKVTIGVCRSWCNVFARLIAIWADGKSTGKLDGGTADRVANKAIKEVDAGATCEVVGEVAGKAIGVAASKTVGGAASRAAGGVAGKVAGGVIGRVTSEAANGATSGFTGRTAGKIGIMRIWKDITIISTNFSAYVPKLKKWSKQLGSSSFCGWSTDVIQNATFARRCLQVIGNLRLVSPLFGQVCSAKLFKTLSYTWVILVIVFGPFSRFPASNL